MAKPTGADLVLAWAEGASAETLEPSSNKKSVGFQPVEEPANNYVNILLRRVFRWLSWLRDFEATAHTWSAKQTYSAGLEVTAGDLDAVSIDAVDIDVTSIHATGSIGADVNVTAAHVQSATASFTDTGASIVLSGRMGIAGYVDHGQPTTATNFKHLGSFTGYGADGECTVWARGTAAGETLEYVHAVNATWDGAAWTHSIYTRPSVRYHFAQGVMSIYRRRASGATWVEGLQLGPAGMKCLTPQSDADGGYPASTVALPNELRALMIPKAWGSVSLGATPTVADGGGIASVARNSGTTNLEVTLASAMANTNYAVLITNQGILNAVVSIQTRAVGSFQIQFDVGGSHVDINTLGGNDVTFVVFGRQ